MMARTQISLEPELQQKARRGADVAENKDRMIGEAVVGLRRVASFDDDFAVYRFGRFKRDAFEVVR